MASQIADTKLYLPAHIANFLSHIQFHSPQECHWPAIWLIQNSTCQHMQPISLGMPLANHRAHTHFSLRAQVANFLRNAIGQPDSSYPILLASICSQIPQECHWPATRLTPDDTHRPTSPNASWNSTTGLNTACANTGHIVSTTLTQCA